LVSRSDQWVAHAPRRRHAGRQRKVDEGGSEFFVGHPVHRSTTSPRRIELNVVNLLGD
jgi:hypothetical protein